jgi:hypothetical protein
MWQRIQKCSTGTASHERIVGLGCTITPRTPLHNTIASYFLHCNVARKHSTAQIRWGVMHCWY